MKDMTFSAKTVDLAVLAAAESLGVSADKIQYEVLEEGKKGLFGGKDAVIRVISGKIGRVTSFLEQIVESFPLKDVEVSAEEKDGTVFVTVSGEEASYLIGKRGETLNSLQYLAGLVLNNGEEKYSRITLNINGYREKREKTLEALARRLGNQALRTGRSVTLEPMAPYERRIIHATVQGIDGVSSTSVGEEPRRKVVISSDNPRPRRERSDRGRKQRAPKAEKRTYNEDSLIKDDFLTSSSTVEGLKKEKELRESQFTFGKVEF